MPRFRVLEATEGIPKGLEIEVAAISTGSKIEATINGVDYVFVVDGISIYDTNKFKIFNSNAIAVVEILN